MCFSKKYLRFIKVRKRAKIRNRYNEAAHRTQDTNGKVTTSQLDITNEIQEVSPFPADDHKASTNRHKKFSNKCSRVKSAYLMWVIKYLLFTKFHYHKSTTGSSVCSFMLIKVSGVIFEKQLVSVN